MRTTRQPNTAEIRKVLGIAFDDSALSAFCFDYFPQVYDRFSQGMRKRHKIILLLDYCRRHPTGFKRLLHVVRQEYKLSRSQRLELLPLIDLLETYIGSSHKLADSGKMENQANQASKWVPLVYVLGMIGIPAAVTFSAEFTLLDHLLLGVGFVLYTTGVIVIGFLTKAWAATSLPERWVELYAEIPDATPLFFKFAGFELVSYEETTFVCKAQNRYWQKKFPQPIFVALVFGKRLNAETIWKLRNSALQAIGEKPTIFVVVDRTPTDDGWLQIATMRAENVQVIPIDDTVISKGQEQGHQRQVLAKHLRRFLGNDRDFYDVRDPVADRLNFFGREALAGELMEALIEGHPLGLFGLRKIGKSSLLKVLRDKLPFPTALVDLQAGTALASVYERILTSWSRSIRVKVEGLEWLPPDLIGSPNPTSAFTLAVHQLLKLLEDSGAPQRLCLLVDEVDLLIPDDRQGMGDYLAFTRSLRGLVQEEEHFSLLIAGVDPSLNRINRWQGQQNPFYQFFREIYLPPLDYDDCIQMIRNIGAQMNLVYSDAGASFVAQISGGHPFLARQLCSLAFRGLGRRGEVPLAHLQEAAQRFIREPGTAANLDENGLWGEISNPYLWEQPQVVENQAILMALASREPQSELELRQQAQDRRAFERSLHELEQRFVLRKAENGRFKFRLALFREWIRRYKLGEE